MAAVGTLLERATLPETLYGHDWFTGAATAPYSGTGSTSSAPITGGIGFPTYTVTTTSSSGSGSLAQARSSAAAGGGGYIVFAVSGTWTLGSTFTFPQNVTLDGRGQDVTLRMTTETPVLCDAQGDNQVMINIRQQRTVSSTSSSSDIWRSYDGNGTRVFLANNRFTGNVDGRIDMTRAGPGGSGITQTYNRLDGGYSYPNRGGLLEDGGPDAATYGGRGRATLHHNVYESYQRQPLSQVYTDSYNNVRRWASTGAQIRNGSGRYWSEYDTYDASLASSSRTDEGVIIGSADVSDGGTPTIQVFNARHLNGSTQGTSNRGSMDDPDTQWTRNPCVIDTNGNNAEPHDDWVNRVAGNSMMVTIAGTAEEMTFTCPSIRSWASGTTWITTGVQVLRAGSVVSITGTATRTSSQVATFQPDSGQLQDGDELYWFGQDSGGNYLISWNPMYITDDGGTPPPEEPEGRDPSVHVQSATNGGETVNTPNASVEVSVTFPSSPTEGNVLIATAHGRSTGISTLIGPPPSEGWTEFPRIYGTNTVNRVQAWWRTIGAGEDGAGEDSTYGPFTYASTGGTADDDAYLDVGIEERTADPDDPIGAIGTVGVQGSLSTSITAPGVNPEAVGAVVGLFSNSAGNFSITPPPGMTERFETTMSAEGLTHPNGGMIMLCDEDVADTTATGDRTATGSVSSTSYRGLLIAINGPPDAAPNLSGEARSSTRVTGDLTLDSTAPVQPRVVASGGNAASAGSVSSSAAISAAVDRKLLACVVAWNTGGTATTSGVVFNTSESMTLVDSLRHNSSSVDSRPEISLWELDDPTETTADIVATGGSTPETMTIAWVYQDRAGALRAPVSANFPSGTETTNDISSAVGDLVVDFVTAYNTTLTPGSGQTEHVEIPATPSADFDSVAISSEDGASTVTMSWTLGTTRGSQQIVVAVQPVVAPIELAGSARSSTRVTGALRVDSPGAVFLEGEARSHTFASGDLSVILAPEILTTTLPTARVGDPYDGTIEVTHGTPPYTWSVSDGSLPPGLTLDSATGVIGGTPTEEGEFVFTVEVTDS